MKQAWKKYIQDGQRQNEVGTSSIKVTIAVGREAAGVPVIFL